MKALIFCLLAACAAPATAEKTSPLGDPVSIHVSAQNDPYTQFLDCGGTAGVITISGHWVLQQGTFGSSFATFLSKTQAQIEARLDTYLATYPGVDPNGTETIILDIESPHPQNLYTYSSADQAAIVAAYKVRIAAARSKFPNARLGLYGTLNPDPQGRATNAVYLARHDALVLAGQEGLFDQLGVLVPVLYIRFGCADAGPCDAAWPTLTAYTQLGIDGSRDLAALPLLPYMSFSVLNGNSLFKDVVLLDLALTDPLAATLGSQLATLQNASVAEAVLWNGYNTTAVRDPNPNGWQVNDFLCGLP